MKATKYFYGRVFGWSFVDYGDVYCDFSGAGIAGGFAKVEKITTGGPLVVLYHETLKPMMQLIVENGGTIVQEIFEFPGGKRFEFLDPQGNRLAIWCPVK